MFNIWKVDCESLSSRHIGAGPFETFGIKVENRKGGIYKYVYLCIQKIALERHQKYKKKQ